MGERAKQLKQYRKQIGDAWLPVVRRRRLSSSEYVLTERWFDFEIPINIVLRAIRNCSERARRNGYPIFSLGVIKADIEALQSEQARMMVGAQSESKLNGDWRKSWEFDLWEMRELTTDSDVRVEIEQLIGDLPSLKDERQARERFGQIAPLLK
jgi:hypothetical protein